MKHLFLTLAAFFLLSFTTDWTIITINDRIKVSMPGTPKPEVKNGNTLYNLFLDDSTKLTSMAIDMTAMGLNEEQVAELSLTDEFKTQFKQGIQTEGLKVIKENYGQFKGVNYYEFEVEKRTDSKVTSFVMRTVFYKHYLIQLLHTPGTKGEDKVLKDKFFNSLQLL